MRRRRRRVAYKVDYRQARREEMSREQRGKNAEAFKERRGYEEEQPESSLQGRLEAS